MGGMEQILLDRGITKEDLSLLNRNSLLTKTVAWFVLDLQS